MIHDNNLDKGHKNNGTNKAENASSVSHSNQLTSIQSTESYHGSINKKVEKIITALYMVSDYLDVEEPIRKKLRFLSIELLSDVRILPLILPGEFHFSITEIHQKIYEILSFLEIGMTVGFISEMNYNILSREFNTLSESLSQRLQHVNKSYGLNEGILENKKSTSLVFPDDLFSETLDPMLTEINIQDMNSSSTPAVDSIKQNNTSGEEINTSHIIDVKRDTKKKTVIPKRTRALDIGLKIERRNKILKFIKSKREATITDISKIIVGCSQKTIQRELLSLVKDGVLKKIGEKRWSKYVFIKDII